VIKVSKYCEYSYNICRSEKSRQSQPRVKNLHKDKRRSSIVYEDDNSDDERYYALFILFVFDFC